MAPFVVGPKFTTCCARTVPVSVRIPVSAGSETAPAARTGAAGALCRSRHATAPPAARTSATAPQAAIHFRRIFND